MPFYRARQAAFVSLVLLSFQLAAADLLTSWPAGKEPKGVGKLVVENLLARDLMRFGTNGSIHYPEACAGYGALAFAGLTQSP